eukprot:TRINITY_DN17408_c0_g2_i1.p1 TRINITY_DN17408_c0_g2~~TRINITY_DN17408_c0_g2_i1.p1  ORF type:complete len:303 (+),score=73.84 TRINITY_DN17408_c0_g2_i1:111-1019(+)
MERKKVLLMGQSGAGKTSMRSIIFANYLARDAMKMCPTMDVEHSHVRFFGNLVLNLWDCGGQDAFIANYLDGQREFTFSKVEVLIYVFSIGSQGVKKDFQYFRSCLEALREHSPDASVFCLVHKLDLIPPEARGKAFAEKVASIEEQAGDTEVTCFGSSIWDETLFKAWSAIVHSLVPNMRIIEEQLERFCTLSDASEVCLFEGATFLVLSHVTRKSFSDLFRFEKISNIIKQFKLCCSKNRSELTKMTVSNEHYRAFIDKFTSNTFVMVITTNKRIQPALVDLNIQSTRKHFEKLINRTDD